MWSEILLKRPNYLPPSYINDEQSSIFNSSKNGSEFQRQLNKIRLMGVKLADSNRKIGDQIFKNAQSERRQRITNISKPFEKYYEPTRQPNYDFSILKSANSSCYSRCFRGPLYERSFDFLDDSYNDDSISGASLSQLSDNTLFSQMFGDAETSHTLNDSWTDFFDDESTFESIGNKPKADALALTDMLNSLFGSDRIHRYPGRKLPSVLVNTEKTPSKFYSDRKSFSKRPMPTPISNREKPPNSQHKKYVNRAAVVEEIIDTIITDAENSQELL